MLVNNDMVEIVGILKLLKVWSHHEWDVTVSQVTMPCVIYRLPSHVCQQYCQLTSNQLK